MYLNTLEGSAGLGRSRLSRYATALGSMREANGCLDIAVAWGYVAPLKPELVAKIDQVTGTLVVLTAPGRARGDGRGAGARTPTR